MHFRLLFVLTLLVCASTAIARQPQIALIIDDMGNSVHDRRAFKLPTHVAFAILPHTSLSTTFSQQARGQQREVILHMPMEALGHNRLGPGALTAELYPSDIEARLSAALATVPDAIGVNNHMGSKLTQLTLPMRTTMQYLREQQLFFVDSRTTRYSKAESIAHQFGLDYTKRNVFLDHSLAHKDIAAQFRRLIRISQRYGSAVGIAHPHTETLDYLLNTLPRLEVQGIELVPLSTVLQTQQLARRENDDTSMPGRNGDDSAGRYSKSSADAQAGLFE
ncbi:divergent polysaccharide deacetylase family protein [Aestuariibacter halophilus]|uniref:Divergent polysaccharide deacetylase family protein n=1 Tax=Fluctibacter halophilus TaxID=226011 RepID=A0ABS8GA80_9ALTE|nr:divergent polysaccharide deacetylase family protein [Aestuariibacter halophilus]MCC2617344.1 divergent polysaccharide deacetylase family protein [Aestuariibacter halophilus]